MTGDIFTDRDHAPSPDEVAEALGARAKFWQALCQYLAENYAFPPEWKYGGKRWFVWYRKSGKTLVTLYPRKHDLTAQIVLGKDEVRKALALKLGKHVGTLLRGTPQLHDGRWLFISIKTAKDVADLEQLIAIKRRPRGVPVAANNAPKKVLA